MPNTTTISNPAKMHRNAHIANLAISGLTSKEIAKQEGVDISDSQVRRILSDKQCQDIFDHVTRVNIAHAKGINKQFIKLCYDDDKKIRLDAIKQYQKNIGISPSHAPSQFIFNILNQGGSIQFGPAVAAVLDSVIDVEPLEE